MRPPTSFKQVLLKKWELGLQFYGSSSNNMNILERKKVIKLSADVAMASARDGKTTWSRSLIAKASKQDDSMSKNLVRNILGSEFDRLTKPCFGSFVCNKRIRSKKILRRSCTLRRVRKHAHKRVLASSIAKRMVKKRTQVLKGLVPGGEAMDEFSLLEETIDYLLSLQAQVDVMHKLVSASELSNRTTQGQTNDPRIDRAKCSVSGTSNNHEEQGDVIVQGSQRDGLGPLAVVVAVPEEVPSFTAVRETSFRNLEGNGLQAQQSCIAISTVSNISLEYSGRVESFFGDHSSGDQLLGAIEYSDEASKIVRSTDEEGETLVVSG
ncbi:hypothetical protein IFM89_039406 [Coptis chinensis]|uniref:IBH1-like N-terminal domain-containing protein n=1 Tax=Coptis chinensis TaxID=261450 RepID=A0A835M8T9_9MAGN|nr:hypothetical protein IFM89_039406 [Coptis chinensis]